MDRLRTGIFVAFMFFLAGTQVFGASLVITAPLLFLRRFDHAVVTDPVTLLNNLCFADNRKV